MNREEILEALSRCGALEDSDLEPARVALLLAALNHPGLILSRYHHHLDKISQEVGERHKALLDAGADDTLETRLAALKHVLADKCGYARGPENFNDIRNADLIQVMDQRSGLPVALSLLYIHAARAQGWAVCGLDIPGHFVVRLDDGGARLIFDPSAECRILQAADLRRLVKQALGPRSELSADYYKPVPNRDILVRLQNNMKIRQIENEEYEDALRTVEALRRLAPAEHRLFLDSGLLYARMSRNEEAINALENYIEKAPDPRDRHDAALLLQQIRRSMT